MQSTLPHTHAFSHTCLPCRPHSRVKTPRHGKHACSPCHSNPPTAAHTPTHTIPYTHNQAHSHAARLSPTKSLPSPFAQPQTLLHHALVQTPTCRGTTVDPKKFRHTASHPPPLLLPCILTICHKPHKWLPNNMLQALHTLCSSRHSPIHKYLQLHHELAHW